MTNIPHSYALVSNNLEGKDPSNVDIDGFPNYTICRLNDEYVKYYIIWFNMIWFGKYFLFLLVHQK